MIDWNECPAVERHQEKVSGAWVFKGTRIPVRALFENLEGGATLDQFIDWFPGVTREQAQAVLAHAEQSLLNVKYSVAIWHEDPFRLGNACTLAP
jgi:uncharacterized protein (DUF433 family)